MKKSTFFSVFSLFLAGTMAFQGVSCTRARAKEDVMTAVKNFTDANGTNHKSVIKTYRFETLKSITASAGIVVCYTAANTGKTEVKAEVIEQLVPYFDAQMKYGNLVLSIRSNNERLNTDGPAIKVYVTGAVPQKCSFSSGSGLRMENNVKTSGQMQMSFSSGADLTMKNVSCGSFIAKFSSGAEADIESVSCRHFTLSASSGAEAGIDRLVSSSIQASLSSGAEGDLEGIDCDNLTLSVSSSAKCTIKGQCNGAFKTTTSGGGTIDKEDFQVKQSSRKTTPVLPSGSSGLRAM